jgi:hypothetical protein
VPSIVYSPHVVDVNGQASTLTETPETLVVAATPNVTCVADVNAVMNGLMGAPPTPAPGTDTKTSKLLVVNALPVHVRIFEPAVIEQPVAVVTPGSTFHIPLLKDDSTRLANSNVPENGLLVGDGPDAADVPEVGFT